MFSKIIVTGSVLIACAAPGSAKGLKPTARMTEARAGHSTSTLPDGRLIVIGGFRKGSDGRSQIYSATSELFDPARGALTAGPRMRQARSGHVAVELADGRVLVAGGWDDGGMVGSAEVFDPETSAFSPVGALGRPRGGAAAVRLRDGRVLVCGGGDGEATATAELYDPADGRFHPTGAMRAARLAHTATLLADGRVLIAGGAGGRDQVLASAELYDPASGTFASAGEMGIARYKHAAIALPDGRVLIAGGSSADDWTGKYDTTELFEPAARRFTAGPTLTTARFKLADGIALVGEQVVIGAGATTVEVVAPGQPSRVIAHLGRASYNGTVTAAGARLVVIGGYDDRVRAADAVWVMDVSTSKPPPTASATSATLKTGQPRM